MLFLRFGFSLFIGGWNCKLKVCYSKVELQSPQFLSTLGTQLITMINTKTWGILTLVSNVTDNEASHNCSLLSESSLFNVAGEVCHSKLETQLAQHLFSQIFDFYQLISVVTAKEWSFNTAT